MKMLDILTPESDSDPELTRTAWYRLCWTHLPDRHMGIGWLAKLSFSLAQKLWVII
jgi:hypothetical protein